MNYIKFARFFYLWDGQDGDRHLTTCECPPFISCGCWSLKVNLRLLPAIGDRFVTWSLSMYFMKLWVTFCMRTAHVSRKVVYRKLLWGLAKRVESSAWRSRSPKRDLLKKRMTL